MKSVLNILLALLLTLPATARDEWKLAVSSDGRYLEHADGRPFLYLADTGWEMLARLTLDEADTYMSRRAAQGFSVIQTVLLSELEGLNDTVAAGMPRLVGGDVCRLNPDFAAHVDSVLAHARRLGLYLALLPTWGDKVDRQWGNGPEVFDEARAAEYGRMLGRRWASQPNIIWVIGGDRGGDGRNKAIWNAMARGIKAEDPGHLMTFHPHGEHSSGMWFHNEDWLDFNMIQSGHFQADYEIYRRLLLPELARRPRKPAMDGEPRYEAIARNFRAEDGRFEAIDVRRTLYQSMLSGACGYTYGNNNVWQMYAPGRKPMCCADRPWQASLDDEGASQLVHFINLWRSVPFAGGSPVGGVAKALDGYTADEAVAFATGDTLLCYFPGGCRWQVTLPENFAGGARYRLMDPRTGGCSGSRHADGPVFEITIPDGADRLLIINK